MNAIFRIPESLPAQVTPAHKGLLLLEQWSSVCPRRGLQPRWETR